MKGISKKNEEKIAREHSHWVDEWNAVVFTDEKKWNFSGPDGFYNLWMENRRNTNFSRIEGARGGVMVWGAIAASGPVALVLMEGKFNSKKYIEMLDKNLLCDLNSLFR